MSENKNYISVFKEGNTGGRGWRGGEGRRKGDGVYKRGLRGGEGKEKGRMGKIKERNGCKS